MVAAVLVPSTLLSWLRARGMTPLPTPLVKVGSSMMTSTVRGMTAEPLREIRALSLGASTAINKGNSFVRKVFLVVVAALALRLAYDTVRTLF